MIESIASELCAECFLTWSEAHAVASVVLDKIESHGMQPPRVVEAYDDVLLGTIELATRKWEDS
jgi:hypothetical protein